MAGRRPQRVGSKTDDPSDRLCKHNHINEGQAKRILEMWKAHVLLFALGRDTVRFIMPRFVKYSIL